MYAGAFDFKDTKTEGFIEVIKIWKGLKDIGRVDLKISTGKPTKNPLGYTFTFSAGDECFSDGSKTNEIVYSKTGKLLSGVYKEPVFHDKDGRFGGWDGYSLDSDGNILQGVLKEDSVVNPINDYFIKYAVTLYGIEINKDYNSKEIGGLTFIPAFTTDHIKDPRSEEYTHTPDGVTSLGNPHRCLGVDSWSTVVEWNYKDPYVYEQCVKRCTKTISFDKSESSGIWDDSYRFPKMSGSGVSGLFLELLPVNRMWSVYGSSNQLYYASSIFALLNGVSGDTTDGYALDRFVDGNCIISEFPPELINSIASIDHALGKLYLLVFTDSRMGECKGLSMSGNPYVSYAWTRSSTNSAYVFNTSDFHGWSSVGTTKSERVVAFCFTLK